MPRPRKTTTVTTRARDTQAADHSGYVDRPIREPAPITLAPVSTHEITDAMVGLPEDPIAQARAVEYVQAASAFRARQHAALPRPVISAVEVPIGDDALKIIDISDPMTRDVAEALERLVNRPRVAWLG
ncbi:hypothetical protein U8607_02540 [Methylobacterium durans]|uniref:hypothetical protein n=1 Tax=Methylobacterium durans TaxID=2202825 RepID=UPI002AFDF4E3|nr:hypothetical protein [Methylobacterium durans]MEA1830949.1 hypothetical protein [Methylobacterium durans]